MLRILSRGSRKKKRKGRENKRTDEPSTEKDVEGSSFLGKSCGKGEEGKASNRWLVLEKNPARGARPSCKQTHYRGRTERIRKGSRIFGGRGVLHAAGGGSFFFFPIIMPKRPAEDWDRLIRR